MQVREGDNGGSNSVVDGKCFLVFASIESDPNASTVGWLQARLAELATELRSGRTLSLYEPKLGKQSQVSSLPELRNWVLRHFPIANFGTEEWLMELAGKLRSGQTLSLYEPKLGKQCQVSSLPELRDWAQRNYPIARFGTEG